MQDQGSANQQGSADAENTIPSGSTRTITIPGDIQVKTIEQGDLRLRRIVMGNLPELLSLLRQEVASRIFIARYISELLVSPKADEQAIVGWSDELLKQVAVQWLHAVSDEKILIATEDSPFEDIEMALRAQVNGQQEIIDKAVVSMLKPVQQVAKALQQRQDVLTEMTRAITATRFQYAIPRFDIGIASALNSMNEIYGLTSARKFMESNRSATHAARASDTHMGRIAGR